MLFDRETKKTNNTIRNLEHNDKPNTKRENKIICLKCGLPWWIYLVKSGVFYQLSTDPSIFLVGF